MGADGGHLTLEIANVGEVPVKLVPGMMIGQLDASKNLAISARI
jgi:deoxycytidine triphosphate deaminase